ncbi:cell surface protein [Halostagnicola sp. A-GB9-2]|uniref:YncE family protein n=1 Tax=Halostagnicola sp. A-GB9-2 TaxID=3048066 RepID=UPI0024C033C2|nr:cell surface protein [Halostagnicola sp. A-GB9-2]MDJ1431871.1 cell surface protein [Halostagnicola sp. A-GB9-2]
MTVDPMKSRRAFLAGSATAGAIALAGCSDETDEENGGNGDDNGDGSYEIWGLDQGRDDIYVYQPDADEDDEFELVEEIDVNDLEDVPDEGVVPHMIDFSSDYEYAAVACTAGARTLVFRTEDYELVGNIETGPGSHMAVFSPDDEYIHVDVINEETISRIDANLEDEEFEIEAELELLEDETVQDAGIESASPICHQFDSNGRSIHTLGPSYHDSGLVIVDHDEFEVEIAYSQDELPTNCGTMPHPEEDKFYLTAGLPSDPDEGEDGVGEFYVYDTAEDEIIEEERSTEGVDAHGFWFTPDGEELWVLNRETNDGIVLDPEDDSVIEEIDAYGPAQSENPDERDSPDIMWSSPDGEYMFVTLRGPAPLSGDPHAATGVTPGFSVIDVEDRDIVDVVEPEPIGEFDDDEIEAAQEDEDDAEPLPDFHGLGVRPIDEFDSEIPNSPPFN